MTGAARSSAEVVAEAPSDGRRTLPLTDFGTAGFTAVRADSKSLATFGPDEITMPRTAVSALTGAGNFRVTYTGFASRPCSVADPAAGSQQPGAVGAGGGTSRVGLRSKKPVGLSTKPHRATGMTGQSSGRGMWVGPNVCHTTMSAPSMSRSPAMNAGRPAPPGFWFDEVAGRVALVRVVAGDPQVVGREPGPGRQRRVRVSQQHRRRLRVERVTGRDGRTGSPVRC